MWFVRFVYSSLVLSILCCRSRWIDGIPIFTIPCTVMLIHTFTNPLLFSLFQFKITFLFHPLVHWIMFETENCYFSFHLLFFYIIFTCSCCHSFDSAISNVNCNCFLSILNITSCYIFFFCMMTRFRAGNKKNTYTP